MPAAPRRRAPHAQLLEEAIALEARAQAALMGGEAASARETFAAAADRYLRSWAAAPPRAYGRIVGALKAGVLAGDAAPAAAVARESVPAADSPTAAYALALAALVLGDEEGAAALAPAMRGGSDAFDRTATAIAAVATGDREAYAAALAAIVADFEARTAHLTGVAIADTALVLERLAAARGLSSGVRSRVLPGGG
jgi:hypothetical protein